MRAKKIYSPVENDIQLAKWVWAPNRFDKALLWFGAIFSWIVAATSLINPESPFGVAVFYVFAGSWATYVLVKTAERGYVLDHWWEKTSYVYSIIIALLFLTGVMFGILEMI